MSAIVSSTQPNEVGEMLWMVHFASSYYDNDPRMPGTVPVDADFFVLARGQQEAIEKVQRQIVEAKRGCDRNAEMVITAAIVTIEDLIPARNCSEDGRLGFVSMSSLAPVELACDEDAKRYRLAVCLVPAKAD